VTQLRVLRYPLLFLGLVVIAFSGCKAVSHLWSRTQPSKVAPAGKIIDYPTFLLYVPGTLNPHTTHPLVIALSPNGDAREMIRVWGRHCG